MRRLATLLLFFPTALLAQVRLGPEVQVAPFTYAGVAEDLVAIVRSGTGWATFVVNRERNDRIVYTYVDSQGIPDVAHRIEMPALIAVAESKGRPLVFLYSEGETYATRVSDEGELVGREHVASGMPRGAQCGETACVVFLSVNFVGAAMTDLDGRPIGQPIPFDQTLSRLTFSRPTSIAVDPDGFAFVGTDLVSITKGSFVRVDRSGRITANVPIAYPATPVWTGTNYALFAYSVEGSSRNLLETDITIDGRASEPRTIRTDSIGAPFSMTVASLGTSYVIALTEPAAQGSSQERVSLTHVDTAMNVISRSIVYQADSDIIAAGLSVNGYPLLVYSRRVPEIGYSLFVVPVSDIGIHDAHLLSRGPLSQRALAIANPSSAPVTLWYEMDGEAGKTFIYAVRIARGGAVIDSPPLKLGEGVPADVRAVAVSSDAIFLWKRKFGGPTLYGAIVHAGGNHQEFMVPTPAGFLLLDALPAGDYCVLIGTLGFRLVSFRLTRTGTLVSNLPTVIEQSSSGSLIDAASDGNRLLILLKFQTDVRFPSAYATALVSPDGTRLATFPGLSAANAVAFSEDSYLVVEPGAFERLNREGRPVSKGAGVAVPSFMSFVAIRGGWLIAEPGTGKTIRVSNTDPPTASAPFMLYGGLVALAPSQDSIVPSLFSRGLLVGPFAASAVFYRELDVSAEPRRRSVAPR